MNMRALLLFLAIFGKHTMTQSIDRIKEQRFEGDSCSLKSGGTGICRKASQCRESIRANELHCEFAGNEPVICCSLAPNATFDSSARIVENACSTVRKVEIKIKIADHAVGVVEEALVGEFPFMGLIHYDDNLTRCGAALISDRFLLTAAHCFKNSKPTTVSLGTNQADDPMADNFPIAKIHRHLGYNRTTKQNDIALVELRSSVTMNSQIQAICLHTSSIDLLESVNLTLMGWGRNNTDKLPNSLLKGAVNPVLRSSCQARFTTGGHSIKLTEKQLCALGEKNEEGIATDACEGDSGGPLVLRQNNKYYLVGVVSTGSGCGDENYAGVYTRVASYLDWIIARAWKN
ncbi:trypsin I-P1-like [Topomyia yanbarensis]|uniref:trypsin I-P1-like n=1 Tax=Topomyia yanbarensis TaxID=2498891 RepID=UPI00273B2770|nr:trypsin I-P1-like [Topomyia yanbarensis]XP_058833035.1 trypsin I-P1-like [Topomyia yanbarensis]XP_058833043.1 trypsin I-P1-like [Topomyia yanbarensis]